MEEAKDEEPDDEPFVPNPKFYIPDDIELVSYKLLQQNQKQIFNL